MSKIPRVGDLEIDQDLRTQAREWVVERIGWAALAVLLLAAVLGAFGKGVFSDATASRPGVPVRVQYERVLRRHAAGELRLVFEPGAVRNGRVSVALARSYLDKLQVQRIMPEPRSSAVADDRVVFTFDVSDVRSSAAVMFDFEPEVAGSLPGFVVLGDAGRVEFGSFVFP